MFSALQRNSIVHILEKTNEHLVYKVGRVDSTTAPIPKNSRYNQQFPYTPNIEYVMDIKLNIDGDIKEFKEVPSNLSIAKFDNGNYVLGETKEIIDNEVLGIMDSAEQVINSYNYNLNIANDCKTIHKQLNPQFAKEEERDNAIENLRNEFGTFKQEVTSMKSDMSKILGILSKNGNT